MVTRMEVAELMDNWLGLGSQGVTGGHGSRVAPA